MPKEKYKPSPEEMARAEGMMTDEQKELSKAREEGYKLGEKDAIEKIERPPAETVIEYSDERTTETGIRVFVKKAHFIEPQNEYQWHFQKRYYEGQVQLPVGGRAIRIAITKNDPKFAQSVFEHAVHVAEHFAEYKEKYLSKHPRTMPPSAEQTIEFGIEEKFPVTEWEVHLFR